MGLGRGDEELEDGGVSCPCVGGSVRVLNSDEGLVSLGRVSMTLGVATAVKGTVARWEVTDRAAGDARVRSSVWERGGREYTGGGGDDSFSGVSCERSNSHV